MDARSWSPAVAAVLLAACFAACTTQRPPAPGPPAANAVGPSDPGRRDSWPVHGGTDAEDRFSPLDQVRRDNVGQLGLVWSFDVGLRGGIEATPLMVDGVLYVTGPWSTVYALDARTGAPRWAFDPRVPRLRGLQACCDVVNRGVAYAEGKVFVGTLDGRLVALDARTGAPAWEVVTVDQSKDYTITGAPRVVRGRVVIGNGGAEYGVRGYVSAYDAATGALAWRTYTVPGDPSRPFESPALARAATTWTGAWWERGGGGTVWDGMAYDPALDLLYVGTGNGSPWNRRVRSPQGGDNLYLSSILALRASDGAVVWHYQTTPGDHWDFTATQPLILTELEIAGRRRRVVMQAPKNGFFYVLDRATGELLSAKNYVPVSWADGVDLVTGRPRERADAVYGAETAEVTPTAFGGHNWQPMAHSAATGLTYLPVQEMRARYAAAPPRSEPGVWNTAATFSRTSAPAGFLLAWDPARQAERWRAPLAHWWNGGALATAGGLVFHGGGDGRLVAYDDRTGAVLWAASTGIGIIGSPITYAVDGTQYVTIAAGWGGAGGRTTAPVGDAARFEQRGRVLTFALGGRRPMPALAARPRQPFVPTLDLPEDSASTSRGRTLFARYCAPCHGAAGASEGAMPNLQRSGQAVHDGFEQIVLGGAREPLGMPSFRGVLAPDDVRAIHAYLVAGARRAARTSP